MLLCCLIPVVVGLGVLFGIFLLPTIVLACFGLSTLFCMAATNNGANNGNDALSYSNATKRMSRREMRKRLVPIDVEEGCCDICLVDFTDSTCTLLVVGSPNPDCSHHYHDECILNWLEKKPTCPCCRAEYLKTSSADVEEGSASHEDANEEDDIEEQQQDSDGVEVSVENNVDESSSQ